MPLLVPVESFGDRAEFGLFHCITALGSSGQEEDLFLDISGEAVEPHDLRHSRRRDLAEMSEFGLVDDGFGSYQLKTVVGQGEQTADAGHAASRCNRLGSTLNLFGSTVFGSDVKLAVDGSRSVMVCAPVGSQLSYSNRLGET